MVGAAAETGMDLAGLEALGNRVNAATRSMGAALTSCTVPAAGGPTFDIGPDEMEMGVGIHGEPGRNRTPLVPASELVATLSDAVSSDLPFEAGDRVLALTNGLGGTPLIELYVVAGELAAYCDARDITIERSLVGSYITSLEMAGCTITLVKADDELLELWDAPVSTAALRW